MTTTAHLPEVPGASAVPAASGRLAIDYWTVVMGEDSCASCDATLTVLNGAVEAVRPLAEQLGVTLEVVPRTVWTWEQALEHQLTRVADHPGGGHRTEPLAPR